jgi:hypothetical protein
VPDQDRDAEQIALEVPFTEPFPVSLRESFAE